MIVLDTMKSVSNKTKRTYFSTLDIAYIAMSVTLIAVCSWITIPLTVPFTMQTFAVFAIVGIFGLFRGTAAVILYLLLGALGAPIFSGFGSGFGFLIGSTGGYLIGFVFASIVTGIIIKCLGNKIPSMIFAMVVGLIVCYIFGTAYFMYVYTQNGRKAELITVLSWCVFPFIIPDLIKIILATWTAKRFSKYVKQP